MNSSLPFTPEQFFEVFAAYNRALWPAVIGLWLYSLTGAVVLARSRRCDRFLVAMLGVQWGWAALAYHAAFFSRINPAAWLFAALFLAQSALFVWFGILRTDLRFTSRGSIRHAVAWMLIAYALAYPFIVQADARDLLYAPSFGLPCPTTLLTIGLLFAADPPWPRVLAAIPVTWAFIAGSAALLLGVKADLMLWVAGGALAGFVLAPARFGRSVRASHDEKSRKLPGDDLIVTPIGELDHAITIHRPRDDVWPWLAQMGAGSRAGWYSYDALDNGRQPSAERIIPELQQLAVNMTFPALPGATDGFTLLAFEPQRHLILGWVTPAGTRLMTWAFVLEDCGGQSTRLIVRARGGPEYQFHGLPWSVAKSLVTLIHFIMQRKQLLGIARRAEARV